MREILFRGKRLRDGTWVYGNLFIDEKKDKHEILCGYTNYRIAWEVDPASVGQFTGLTDKNGTRVYEGDVFKMDEDDIAVVIFKDGCYLLEVHGICEAWTESGFDECGGGYGIIDCDPIDWYYIHKMEVIGNTHDNPELLEV